MQVLLYAPQSGCGDALDRALAEVGDILHRTEEVSDLPAFTDYYDIAGAIVDARFQQGAALQWLREQRRAGDPRPVLVLVDGPVAAGEVLAWLDHADDVVRLPADAREIVARLRAVIRRRAGQPSATMTVDEVTFNASFRTVSVAGNSVHLTAKELHMLEALFMRPQSILTKEMLLGQLYGGMDEPELKIIDVFICKLRKKLTAAGARPDFISTVWGRGYSIAPDARKVDHGMRRVSSATAQAA